MSWITCVQGKPKKRQWAKDKVMKGHASAEDQHVDQRMLQENRKRLVEERAMRQKGIVTQKERFPHFEVGPVDLCVDACLFTSLQHASI